MATLDLLNVNTAASLKVLGEIFQMKSPLANEEAVIFLHQASLLHYHGRQPRLLLKCFNQAEGTGIMI